MQTPAPKYFHFHPDADLPVLEGLRAFKTILVADVEVQETTMWDISRWLIASGSLYVLVWGKDSEQWREAVEDAALEAVNYEDVAEQHRVLVTAHEDDDLEEVFWFARHRASHPADLQDTLILHIADTPRREELEDAYSDA